MRLSMNLFRNIMAFLRGTKKKIIAAALRDRDFSIGGRLRLFKGAIFDVHHKGKCKVGCGVRVDRYAEVIVVENASLSLGDNVGVGPGNRVICRDHIEIGNNTIFGPNVFLYDHDHQFTSDMGVSRREYKTSEIKIGSNCWIGANTVILRGTHIGDNCVIGAGSVIKGDYPNGSKLDSRVGGPKGPS